MRLFSRIFGDDIFISYSRKDGSLYAAGLADKLTEKHFSCFIDRLGVKPGHALPPDLVKKICSCSMLVVIGTKMATESDFVREEIKIFKKTGRIILPVDFENNVGKSIWYEEIPGLASETEKSSQALEDGHPSENIINFIEKSFNYTRRNQYMARMFRAAIATFVILITLGLSGFLLANNEANKARAEATEEKLKAEIARREASEARDEAEKANIQARGDRELANSAAARTEQQTLIADAKAKEAAKATELANEQTRKAELAEDRRIEAEDRRSEAVKAASEQEIQTRINTAENYYNIAEAQEQLPLKALPWLQKAIEAVPETDSRIEIYKLRALQLTQNIPFSLTSTNFRGNANPAAFSPSLDKAFLTTYDSAALWDLKKGIELRIPDDVKKDGHIRFATPIFSPDGKWAAAISQKGDPVSLGLLSPCLNVWEIENVKNYWQKCDARFALPKDVTVDSDFARFDRHPRIYFSPDSRYIIAGLSKAPGKERTSLIWRVETFEEARSISSDVLASDVPEEDRGLESARIPSYRSLEADGQIKEFLRRNAVPVSKDPERSLMIVFTEQPQATIARVVDISSGARVRADLVLEKYVDFIDFSGDAQRIFTVSHNESDKRFLRVWDVGSNEAAEPVAAPISNIIAVSRSGRKIFGEIKDTGKYVIYDLNSRSQYIVSLQPDMLAMSALFLNDEKYLITQTFEKYPDMRQDGITKIIVWDTEPLYSNFFYRNKYAQLAQLPVTVAGQCGLSDSAKDVGVISYEGLISLQRLFPKKENDLDVHKKLPQTNRRYPGAFPSPDFKYLFTHLGKESFGLSKDFQFWNIEKGENVWNQSLEFESGYLVREIHFTPDRKHFLAPIVGDGPDKMLLFDTQNGSFTQPIPGVEDFALVEAAFDRTGTKVVAVGRQDNWWEKYDPVLKVRRWDFPSGRPSGSFDYKYSEFERYFADLTRYGEYIIFWPNKESSEKSFGLLKIDSSPKNILEFKFFNLYDTVMAKSLLKQAEKIEFNERGNLMAVLDSGTAVEFFRTSENLIQLKNKKTGQIVIAPVTSDPENLKISPNGELVAVSSSGGITIWSAKTGFPVTSLLEAGYCCAFFDFLPDSSRILTVSREGVISNWFIGKQKSGLPMWAKDMGGALSGLEITNGTNLANIPQDRLFRIRNDYIKGLREAAASGDEEANYILENLEP